MDDAAMVVLFVSYALLVVVTKLMNKRPNYSNDKKTSGKEIIHMKKIKKIMFTVFLATLMGTTPLLSFADEPQAPTEQQTIVAPAANQSADQQVPPAAPAPQEEGSTTETSK